MKFGDRVKVKDDVEHPVHGWGGVRPGDIGVVKEILPWNAARVDFEKQQNWLCCVDEIECEKLTMREFVKRVHDLPDFKKGYVFVDYVIYRNGNGEIFPPLLKLSVPKHSFEASSWDELWSRVCLYIQSLVHSPPTYPDEEEEC